MSKEKQLRTKAVIAKIFFGISAAVMLFCWIWFGFTLWYLFIRDTVSFQFGVLFAMFFSVPEIIAAAVFCCLSYVNGWLTARTYLAVASSCLPVVIWIFAFLSLEDASVIWANVAILSLAIAGGLCTVVFSALDLQKLKRSNKK